jgi:2-polyprenyl-3-methyl-5-hydroxy-6-metoxy-1,4-benzoquinol methylase
MSVQETQGLLSPVVRDIRLRRIARCIEPGSTVLDLGCGAGYLGAWLPPRCRYVGIDRALPPRLERFADFLRLDLNADDAAEAVRSWLPAPPRCITCAAVLEHVDSPLQLLRNFSRLLASGGRFVGTTAHPWARPIHTCLAGLGVCSREGAAEHHAFLDYARLHQLAADSGGRLVEYNTFLLRLNQLFVVEY